MADEKTYRGRACWLLALALSGFEFYTVGFGILAQRATKRTWPTAAAPIMGASVFIMSEIIGVPYVSLMLYGLVPALLYFGCLSTSIYFEASRIELGRVPRDEIPKAWDQVRRGGYLLIPVFILLASIVSGETPGRTGFKAVMALLVMVDLVRSLRWIRARCGTPGLALSGAAHMFIFYFGVISSITPPVALAAYGASGISGANAMQTGFTACRLAITAFIVPFLFTYYPELLLLEGSFWDVCYRLGVSLAGIYLVSMAAMGYGFRTLRLWERIALSGMALLLFLEHSGFDLLGLALGVAHMLWQRKGVASG